jgi:uncharacterized delta-60 repeat protein
MRIGIIVFSAVIAPALAFAQALDTSFGASGQFTLEMAGGSSFFFGSTRQLDGKIVAVGGDAGRAATVLVMTPPGYLYEPTVPMRNVLIARLTANGSLDTSFGTGGIVAVDFNGLDDRGLDVVQQSDGKLLVLARAEVTPGNHDLGLVRLNTDGSLDASFNFTGKLTLSLGGTDDRPAAMASLPDGAVVIAGTTTSLVSATSPPGDTLGFVLRLRSDGTLDANFGSAGRTFVGGVNDRVIFNSMAVQADGKVVAAGSASMTQPVPITVHSVFRFTTSGSLDPTFGAGGNARFSTPLVGAVAVDASSSLTVAGVGLVTSGVPSPPGARFVSTVVRYDTSGTLDPSFRSGNALVGFIDSTQDNPSGLALEPNGKILVSGTKTNVPPGSSVYVSGPLQPFVARLLANGNLDTTFGTSGVFAPAFSDASTQTRGGRIKRRPDGRLELVGHTGQPVSVSYTFGELTQASQRGMILRFHSTPTYSFATNTASISEDQGILQLSLNRTGSTSDAVSVRVRTVAQTASTNSDFAPLDTVVTWLPQDVATKSVTLVINNDTARESDEQLAIVMSEPSEGSIGDTSAISVTVTDDDPVAGSGGGSGAGGAAAGGGGGGGGALDWQFAMLLLAFRALALQRTRSRRSETPVRW